MNKALYKGVMKKLLFITLTILLCRVTGGYFGFVIWLIAVMSAFQKKYGMAISCFALFPFMVVLNPVLLPKSGFFGHVLRFGPLGLGVLLAILTAQKNRQDRVPLGALFLYLLCAAASSVNGWCAPVSYMKLVNFTVFITGIWLGVQNLQSRPSDILSLRYFFLGLASFVAFGSLLTLPFPAIAYPLNMNVAAVLNEYGVEAANEYYREITSAQTISLFAGVTMHSQTLGPMCACIISLVLADMLFIVKRATIMHAFLLLILSGMLYMTRSRTALLSTVVGIVVILYYATKHIDIGWGLKRRVRNMALSCAVIICLAALGSEIANDAMSRWIRKTNDASEFDRDLVEAVTNTRMGLFEEGLDEFRRNPLLGMGFQVNSNTEVYYKSAKGLVLSAPVEKGLLPMMILGEGGVVGVIAFCIFLFSFYRSCASRHLVVTASMFTVFLATNMGEATFFSPGGAGGVEWVLCAVGGYVIDTAIIYRLNLERYEMFSKDW